MKYSNVEVLKELRRIRVCLDLTYSKEEWIEDIRKCIYKNGNPWILNYLVEQKLVNMSPTSDNVIIPFISAYWNDFLKRSLVGCIFEDYKEIIYLISAIATITWTILIMIS